MTQGKLNQSKEDQQDSVESILEVILKSLLHQKPKMPKIFKSSSSPERPKLEIETLYSPTKGSPAIV
jgi:hypothetical protein